MKKQGKQGKELVEPIDFNKLRENLKTIMEEVDRRLESEYDAFSPKMWAKLRERVDLTVLEIKAVRLALNGMGTVEVANKLGVKRQQVAAVLAFNTMLQHDYADPETIINAVDCQACFAGIGNRCVTHTGNDAGVHETRRDAYRTQMSERALNTNQIRKIQERVANKRHLDGLLEKAGRVKAGA